MACPAVPAPSRPSPRPSDAPPPPPPSWPDASRPTQAPLSPQPLGRGVPSMWAPLPPPVWSARALAGWPPPVQNGGASGRFADLEPPKPSFDCSSAFSSPTSPFSLSSSAPSTARSRLSCDVHAAPLATWAGRLPFSKLDGQGAPAPALIKAPPHPVLTPRSAAPDPRGAQTPSWPPPLSSGEEAFYSKSNVTQSHPLTSASTLPPSGAGSPSFWHLPDASRPSSNSSPSPTHTSAPPQASTALVSPFSSRPFFAECQLSSRLEVLERKSSQQENDIAQLKSRLGLVCAQLQKSQLWPPTSSPNAPSAPDAPQTPTRAPPAALNLNPAPGLDTLGRNICPGSTHGSQPNLTANPVLGHTHEPSPQSQGGWLQVNGSGFPCRPFGPLDYSPGQSNAFGPTVPLLHQASCSMPMNVIAVATNAPGVVNYRALLAGETECNYEYFIRRITEHNDQQASIFLQQKLKQSSVATGPFSENTCPSPASPSKARADITRLVIEYGLELMANRFGNFLVSRAIEHATVQERLTLAERIKGFVVMLAQDTFATHCLQRMIDVDEEGGNQVRGLISNELLMKKETVTHKSAGHVWARLLSIGGGSSGVTALRTNGEKPGGPNHYGSDAVSSVSLEQRLNELLKGEWAKTAKDEVGSLIVQSVLENWNESSKADVIDELMSDIYSCSVKQWGNFVVLHLIEHSSGEVQKRLFQRLTETQLACELSVDNFGAKAIEKVLKVSGMDSKIVADYVRAICEYGHGRPALIDIACHQAGAQVLTLLFTSAPDPIRELMIQTVRKNGVTMKSSKAGSKIWFLVERTRAWVGH